MNAGFMVETRKTIPFGNAVNDPKFESVKKYCSKNYQHAYIGETKQKIINDYILYYRHGTGSTYYKDGTIYTGQYVNNKMHGHGSMKYDIYTSLCGHWENDKLLYGKKIVMNSLGIVVYTYLGSFNNEFMPDGYGCETIGKKKVTGFFKNGVFKFKSY